MSSFVTQSLANLSWSCSKLDFVDHPLLESIAGAALALMSQEKPFMTQELASMAWAFSLRLVSHEPLLAAISSASIRRMTEFGSQEVANTAWAFAKSDLMNQPLLTALSAAARASLAHFRHEELASIVWTSGTIAAEGLCAMPVTRGVTADATSQFAALSLSSIVRRLATACAHGGRLTPRGPVASVLELTQ